MKLIKDLSASEPMSAALTVHSSVCYDFVVSLRVLMNPRTYKHARHWAAGQRELLDGDLLDLAAFYFEGFDTALGFGATRIIAKLEDGAGPADLISAIRTTPAEQLALYMLDTGETSEDRLAGYASCLAGDITPAAATRGLPAGWDKRCRRVLTDPEQARADLVSLLEGHQEHVFGQYVPVVEELLDAATQRARALQEYLPASGVIETLAGGYTFADDLRLNRVVLAPSVFVHPFMSTRVDEESGEAMVVYGIPSDVLAEHAPVSAQDDILAVLKALADPNRLTILRLLAEQPRYTTEVVDALRLGQPTVHHHMTLLRTAGLVRQERSRHGMRYSVRPETAKGLVRTLQTWLLPEDSEISERPTVEEACLSG